MLVRDIGDHFQIVLQPDHAELSGQIAASWSSETPLSADVRAALDCAAARHDEGWAVWERHPRLNDDGQPQIFYNVPLESLLSSYRACVDVLAAEDEAAALLVSMHVSGLQRKRYGVMGDGQVPPLAEMKPAVREFVQREERRQKEMSEELGFDERERWLAYRQLQVYDVFSLYLGLADLSGGEDTTIPAMPQQLRAAGEPKPQHGPLRIAPSADPWTVECDPFPLNDRPTRLTMRRRLLPKRRWSSEASFRSEFQLAATENVAISVRGSATS